MQTEAFEAKNELEAKLLAAIGGERSSEEFMQDLLAAQVFLPVKDDRDSGIKGFQFTTLATPLVVEGEDGAHTLVAFTSPERARDFLQDLPGYGGGLLAEFSWVLERLGAGYSVAINPGLEAGVDVAPETIAEMRALLAADTSE